MGMKKFAKKFVIMTKSSMYSQGLSNVGMNL